MTIEWNKVTWYSKITAAIFFVGTFYLGFWLGTMKIEEVYVEVPRIVHRSAGQVNPTNSLPQTTGNENLEVAESFYHNNSAPDVLKKEFQLSLGDGEFLSGPALSYIKNSQVVKSLYVVGTTTLEYHRTANGLLVKEGPYEWYMMSNSQCGACAHASFNVYYFDAENGTSSLAFSYPFNTYDLNDTDFEISLDWSEIVNYEFQYSDTSGQMSLGNLNAYHWKSTSYCLSQQTHIYQECGIKYNVQPPKPRNFQPTRQWSERG